MSHLRFKQIEIALNREPFDVKPPHPDPTVYFGQHVFDQKKMATYLPRDAYEELTAAIKGKRAIGRELADVVAQGMKKWAMDNGATHYTHWFHPLTDGTAEKHDSFIDLDDEKGIITDFSGKLLIQQEPDASSFPSGGLRNTFEARGYTAWDISSPAFIHNGALCIPTIFIAYSGESLDYKTPLLRALNCIDRAGTKVARLFDPQVQHVISYLGWEQEYFLIDEALFAARPDLVMTGRTLMGHESAKNQQLDDHYFGSIPMRVQRFMEDLEIECYQLGIPLKTKHNEVAPNQFELAPIYEEANLSNDHNLLLMKVMAQVARRHKFRAILHEKPFAGINGSGKHNNWSLGTDTGVQLFKPGKTPMQNLQFIAFIAATMAAVHKHNDLVKASIATANNTHRLGANEAPPAIISIFLGRQLSKVIDQITGHQQADGQIMFSAKEGLNLQMAQIPEILLDNTDRNRTSPFAFTGNRFEFRAVGSSAKCASAMIVLNTIVADQLNAFHQAVTAHLEQGDTLEQAVMEQVQQLLTQAKPIHFDGNGYSEQWPQEAASRGLDTENSVPRMIDAYSTPKALALFERTHVFSQAEIKARSEVKWETYCKKIHIEASVIADLTQNHILPVAIRYQNILLDNVLKLKALGKQSSTSPVNVTIEHIAENITGIDEHQRLLAQAIEHAMAQPDSRLQAFAFASLVVPHIDAIRHHVDALELLVDDEMWPLPKYRELLFIR